MNALLVWFDGGCPLCRREISLLQQLDRAGAIRFIDVSVEQVGCPIDPGALLSRFHAMEDGRLLSGAAAFAAMWRAVPMLRPLGLAAQNPLVLTILEWLYCGFLRIRPLLQRLARRLDSHYAEGYAAGELKHGPIALIDETMPVIVIAPPDPRRACRTGRK